MKLVQLTIENSQKSAIRARAHYITEQFLYFFNKIDLDGSSKLVIFLEIKPEHEDIYTNDSYFHVSKYYVEKSVHNRFDTIKENELDEYFLNIVVNACKHIAILNSREEKVIQLIDAAADKIRENKFELILLQKKLTKTSADKRFCAKVYRQINRLGEKWYAEIEDKTNKTVTKCELMTHYTNISLVDAYKKSFWENHKFILQDRLDRTEAMIKVRSDGVFCDSWRGRKGL